MKYYLFFVLLFISLQCFSQGIKNDCPQVFYHSSEIYADTCSAGIKSVGHNIFKNKISISYFNAEKIFIPLDSLWGLKRKDENPTRLVNESEYEIAFFSPIIIYSQHHFKSTKYYFSKTLDDSMGAFQIFAIVKIINLGKPNPLP